MQIPEYCPNPKCKFHNSLLSEEKWCKVAGSYKTKLSGKVHRFRCLNCGRTFSERTFSLDYCTKRQLSYQKILEYMQTYGSMRKTARLLGVSHQAISNRLQRMARQSIL